MNLIADVTRNITALFGRLRPYQGEGKLEPMKVAQRAAAEAEVAEKTDAAKVARRAALDQSTPLDLALALPEGRERTEAILAVQETEATEREDRRRIGKEIAAELDRLTPDTYPAEDPEAPRLMYEFFQAFASGLAPAGRKPSGHAMLIYLDAAVDHTFWLWKEWINACMAAGDHASAEALLDAEWKSHKFAKYAEGYHGHSVAAKALIFVHRDHDVPKALQYMEKARERFADTPGIVDLYHALRSAEAELRDDRMIGSKRDGYADRFPLTVLTTGSLDGDRLLNAPKESNHGTDERIDADAEARARG